MTLIQLEPIGTAAIRAANAVGGNHPPGFKSPILRSCAHTAPRVLIDSSMRRHPSRGTRAGTGHTAPDWMPVQRAFHRPVRHEDWHRASGGC
jgi:hypothetical protein